MFLYIQHLRRIFVCSDNLCRLLLQWIYHFLYHEYLQHGHQQKATPQNVYHNMSFSSFRFFPHQFLVLHSLALFLHFVSQLSRSSDSPCVRHLFASFLLHTLEPVFTKRDKSDKIGIMKKENRKSYPSDLTDRQWKEIESLYTGMRKCKWSKRELTNAVLYLVDTGCKWRQLPHFPPYSTVHSFYRRARINGLWNKILKYVVGPVNTK